MTGSIADAVDDYIALRRGLGYRSVTQERALRAFGIWTRAVAPPVAGRPSGDAENTAPGDQSNT